jgi:hypothetical protein
MIEFNYMGLDLTFYPKLTDDRRFHFYMSKKPEFGFFDKSLHKTFGKPNSKNYLEILDGYIKSSPVRVATVKNNAEFLRKNDLN